MVRLTISGRCSLQRHWRTVCHKMRSRHTDRCRAMSTFATWSTRLISHEGMPSPSSVLPTECVEHGLRCTASIERNRTSPRASRQASFDARIVRQISLPPAGTCMWRRRPTFRPLRCLYRLNAGSTSFQMQLTPTFSACATHTCDMLDTFIEASSSLTGCFARGCCQASEQGYSFFPVA